MCHLKKIGQDHGSLAPYSNLSKVFQGTTVQKLTGANNTPLKTLPFTAAVMSKPESKAPSTFPRTSAPIQDAKSKMKKRLTNNNKRKNISAE